MKKKETFRLENWSLDAKNDGYTAPEMLKPFLIGQVYGHPDFDEGATVRTSIVVSSTGRLVSTASGSVYELGTPDPDYVEWSKENGYTIDEEWPVKILKSSNMMN